MSAPDDSKPQQISKSPILFIQLQKCTSQVRMLGDFLIGKHTIQRAPLNLQTVLKGGEKGLHSIMRAMAVTKDKSA
jgi:hypothetical protein